MSWGLKQRNIETKKQRHSVKSKRRAFSTGLIIFLVRSEIQEVFTVGIATLDLSNVCYILKKSSSVKKSLPTGWMYICLSVTFIENEFGNKLMSKKKKKPKTNVW